MGLLVKGEWVDDWYDTEKSKGEFIRQDSIFRNMIIKGTKYEAERGRYHLYVSCACPWAHRTLIFRSLKQLESLITVSTVNPLMLENGWEFGEKGDPVFGFDYLYQLYLQSKPDYQGRVTVPVLWDRKTRTIVSNESSDIIRIFNSAFNDVTRNYDNYYPVHLSQEIDRVNVFIYGSINNGVYRSGFATSQSAYENANDELFSALDWVESRLTFNRYLVGDQITEADWRLFTTLIRFDAVYHGHFKCNRQKLSEFTSITNYMRELYQVPGVKQSINMKHIKEHYYRSHKTINPTGIVPTGPLLKFNLGHNRNNFFNPNEVDTVLI